MISLECHDQAQERIEQDNRVHGHKLTVFGHIYTHEGAGSCVTELLPKMLHTTPTVIKIMRMAVLRTWRNLSRATNRIMIIRGQMQYPRMATDWKNEMPPPRTRMLKVTNTAPTNTENSRIMRESEST